MRPLGPVETFTPAIARTRAILLRPFRLGRFFKLTVCAYCAILGTVFVPAPLLAVLFPSSNPHLRLILFALGLVATLLLFALYYLGSRMQFVLFDLVITLQTVIAPLWRYRRPTLIWRWIGLKFAITLPLAALVLAPTVMLLWHHLPQLSSLFPTSTVPGVPPRVDPAVTLLMLSVELIVSADFLLLLFASSLLSDFILPFLAIEDCSALQAFRHALSLFRAEPTTTLAFVGFQLLLATAGFIAQYAVMVVASLLLAILLSMVAVVGYLALHTLVSSAILTIGGIFLYMLLVTSTLVVQGLSLGLLLIFLRCYSLLFLAGRYPRLGSLLELSLLEPPLPPPLLVLGTT